MCLGGGSSGPAYKPPAPPVYEVGGASPDDMVNNQVVENINDRSRQDEFRNKNQGATATNQSSLKINKAY